jgi:hypothetical protein
MLNISKDKKIKSKLFKKRAKIKYTRAFCKITFDFIPVYFQITMEIQQDYEEQV